MNDELKLSHEQFKHLIMGLSNRCWKDAIDINWQGVIEDLEFALILSNKIAKEVSLHVE